MAPQTGYVSVVERMARPFQRAASTLVFEDSALQTGWSRRFAAAFEFLFPNRFFFRLLFARAKRFRQSFAGQRAILSLRARVLHRHDNARRDVTQRHFGRELVD